MAHRFKKGHAKVGGIQKGTTHKSFRVADVLALYNFNPIEELLKIYPTLNKHDKSRVLLELQTYLEPKPKPPTDPNELQKLSTTELIILIQEKFPEFLKLAQPLLIEPLIEVKDGTPEEHPGNPKGNDSGTNE